MNDDNPFKKLSKTREAISADQWVSKPVENYLQKENKENLLRYSFQIPEQWYERIIQEILPTMYGQNKTMKGHNSKPTLSFYIRNLIKEDFEKRDKK